MTSQTPAITVLSPRRGPGRRLVLGLAAAALAAAAGAGLWQVGRDGGSTSQGTMPERTLPGGSPVEQYPEDRRARSAAAAAPAVPVTDEEMYQAWQRRTPAAPAMVYLVESVARQRALTELGLGADALVLVVMTDEDAAQVRLGQGRLGVAVVDLRTRTAGASGVCRLLAPPAEC